MRLPSGPFARLVVLALLVGAAGACRAPDPNQEIEVREVETYWAVDSSRGDTKYLAPVVRLVLHNKGHEPQKAVQATAVFRRKGEEGQTWGSDWKLVCSYRKPLAVGQDALVVLKSDARYYSTGAPEQMFKHAQFKDAKVQAFVRVGSSGWVKMAEADVEDRIGSRTVPSDAR